ncbi:nuclear transport factor 2 family protein [Roseateles sp. MS654]|uniref:nuclear transport factor 2 family protein n=1 Tax=Roseateles sp. MS654 TaxID=3412685 RepID=UPI003C2C0452
MRPEENKSVLAAVFAETAKGNGRPFIDALADDVQWTIIGTTPWSRTYVGKASVINDLLRPLGQELGGASIITASKFIAEGDLVVVQATGNNVTVRGQRYENTYCWIIRMYEGKMRELTEYADTQLIESVLRDPRVA